MSELDQSGKPGAASSAGKKPRIDTLAMLAEARPYVGRFIFGAIMLASFQLAMNRIDWMSKAAIDALFGKDGASASRPALFMLGLAVFAFLTRVASRWLIFNVGRDVEYSLRGRLLSQLHRLGAAFYRTMSAGEIMSRSTSDLAQVRMLYGFGVLNVINVVFALCSAFQVMLGISGRLTLAAMVMLPLVMITTRIFSGLLFPRMKENQEALGKLTECVQGNLAGVRVIKSFGLEEAELRRFSALNDSYKTASLGLSRLRGLMGPVVGAASAIGMLIFFWYGASLLLRGKEQGGITEGDFFAFSLALGRMTWPMIALGFVTAIVQRGRVSYLRLREILDAQPEVVGGTQALAGPVRGSLRVAGLSFAYGDRTVLADVRINLEAGRSLAVVGRTGSGKTTLAMLLARLLPTPRGTVFLDEHDVCELPLTTVRGAIGYAQQDAFLFSTTVARNIGFALEDPDSPEALEKIQRAAAEAQILNELSDLPDKIDTIVGERGVQLSGGQKQRTALSRALLWQPKILILDDPLSAVDAKTEAAILDALGRHAAGRSLLLITHRVAAAARCDRILVLDKGHVVEEGTHAELLAAGGIYKSFSDEQQMARELEELGQADIPPSQPPPAAAESAIRGGTP